MPGDAARRGRPEWFVLGKPHADRAKQFKPFAALRGYDEMIEAVIMRSQAPKREPITLDGIVDRLLWGDAPDGVDALPEYDYDACDIDPMGDDDVP